MLKLTELNYHCHTEYNTPEAVIAKHRLSSGYVDFIKHKVQLTLVKHLNYKGEAEIENVQYRFFKSRNRFWYIPFTTHRCIKKDAPDVILVQGFVFVLQVIFLRWAVGKKRVILVQHHGEKPYSGIKGFLQRKADACIDGYLFSSAGNAAVWLDKKVISKKQKCFEVLSASSGFTMKDKKACRLRLKMNGNCIFLWVGRLNSNKDPLTVLAAFEKYLAVNPGAALYMIYQNGELHEAVKNCITKSPLLNNAVTLTGEIGHEQLEDWFNAADFYISGSHSEGSGYALAEAMACGCIPVVTAIPSFKGMTQDGRYGMLFTPGNPDDLYKKLLECNSVNKEAFSSMVHTYSKENLSYNAVATQLYQLVVSLTAK